MIINEGSNRETMTATITLDLEDARLIARVLWYFNEEVVDTATAPGTTAEDIKVMHDEAVALAGIAHSMADIERDLTGNALYKRFTKPEEVLGRARRLENSWKEE